jgi:hypothetical protein
MKTNYLVYPVGAVCQTVKIILYAKVTHGDYLEKKLFLTNKVKLPPQRAKRTTGTAKK